MINLLAKTIVRERAGGEILHQSVEVSQRTNAVNWRMVDMSNAIPFIVLGIAVLLIAILVIMIAKQYNITTLSRNGVKYAMSIRARIRRKDEMVMRSMSFINSITEWTEKSIFRSNKQLKDYMDYNLKRTGFKLPNGNSLHLEEYNALKVFTLGVLLAISIFIAVFVSASVGIIMAVVSIWLILTMPMIIIRGIVTSKDAEIRANFMDVYLVLHYSLYMGGETPIPTLLASYRKTTDSPEMHEMVEIWTNHIDTLGEYNATEPIARDYREIAEVGTLMRLIKQIYDGANVKQELIGFRKELVAARKAELEDRGDKIIEKVNMVLRAIIMILLFQAVVSSMAIYIPDLVGGMSGIM